MTQSVTTSPRVPNAEAIACFLTGSHSIPEAVMDQARKSFADSVAVAIGAHDQGAGRAARSMAASWRSQGRAPMLFAGRHAAAPAAFVNGTFGHCLDFDDTHFGSLAHLSNPAWAAALAAGCDAGLDAEDILTAFVLGFEVGARLGQGELGQTVTKRGIHSTAIFGRLAATAAASRILRLSQEQVINAMGAAATQCIGLVASFGTMSKPLHAGKAAMDGILSAQLAAHDFVARPDLLETEGETLAKALVQDHSVKFPTIEFAGTWEILEDTFKPYAACNLTHATIDTARDLAGRVRGRAVERIVAHVHPTVISFAGKADPQTSLEGKFSNAYCTALGLLGYAGTKEDFEQPRLADPAIRDLLKRVELRSDPAQTQTSASLFITFRDGEGIEATTPLASGNPGNPMTWAHMKQKFIGLVEPVIGRRSRDLFDSCRNFGRGDSLLRISDLLSSPGPLTEPVAIAAAR